MIKVMIIDDEYIVRKGLMATVDWRKFDMEVVGDAANGEKGWELFLEHSPDVVITDIVMPEQNGIELARKIKEAAPQTKILLLSCHRDFEYAQEGIKLGASGYIVKTAFQDMEFESYLGRFQDELAIPESAAASLTENEEMLSKTFYEWLCGFENNFAHILDELRQKDWNWIDRPFYIYYLDRLGRPDEPADGRTEILFSGISAKIPCGSEQCFLFIPAPEQAGFERRLFDAKGKWPSMKWRRSTLRQGTEEWLNGVKSLYSRLKIEQQFQASFEDWPEPIRKAVELITADLSRHYPSADVAHEVGLSRSHFSTLFKKSIGESFSEFTEKLKLDAACSLLEATPLTLQEISERIGIHDGKYFSKWFKKCTGKTPSDYRQTKRGTIPDKITPF
ncbi:response regulator [Bacillus sp. B-jedd]|uniref:response regulator n=1 Tax=Bacillus sp. B-jedd TaxID=1476857 RepID=UPI00051564DB|nr:response regulator [Bacillus sp. B-jedd]CEG28485.1 two-component response regulator YesM [Bacillus sp. B-jedd]